MKAPSVTWTDKERLDLVTWLENNWIAMGEDKQKTKSYWWQVCKEDKFANDEHITANRIGEKVTNFNEVYTSKKTTGWGLAEEDTDRTSSMTSFSTSKRPAEPGK
jgi:hypothetical protein